MRLKVNLGDGAGKAWIARFGRNPRRSGSVKSLCWHVFGSVHAREAAFATRGGCVDHRACGGRGAGGSSPRGGRGCREDRDRRTAFAARNCPEGDRFGIWGRWESVVARGGGGREADRERARDRGCRWCAGRGGIRRWGGWVYDGRPVGERSLTAGQAGRAWTGRASCTVRLAASVQGRFRPARRPARWCRIGVRHRRSSFSECDSVGGEDRDGRRTCTSSPGAKRVRGWTGRVMAGQSGWGSSSRVG